MKILLSFFVLGFVCCTLTGCWFLGGAAAGYVVKDETDGDESHKSSKSSTTSTTSNPD